jgi:hypothetical protein
MPKIYIKADLSNFDFIMEMSDIIKQIFAENVNRKTPPQLPNSHFVETKCWDWTGAATSRGYGIFNRKFSEIHIHIRELVHRLAYVVYRGIPIPDGAQINHICKNSICFNPDHLKIGNAHSNGQDKCNQYYTPKPFNRTYKLGRLEKQAIRILKQNSSFTHQQIASIFRVSDTTICHVLSKKIGKFTDSIGIEDPDYISTRYEWTKTETNKIMRHIKKGFGYGDVLRLSKEMNIDIGKLRGRIGYLRKLEGL